MPAAFVGLALIRSLQTHRALAKSLPHADMEAIASPPRLPGPGRGTGAIRKTIRQRHMKKANNNVAKTSPGEFVNQVRNEARKVVWPTRKETVTTAIMVLIMTTLLAIFFLGVDAFFSSIVKFLLGLLG